jgi:hypothetical protein
MDRLTLAEKDAEYDREMGPLREAPNLDHLIFGVDIRLSPIRWEAVPCHELPVGSIPIDGMFQMSGSALYSRGVKVRLLNPSMGLDWTDKAVCK